LKLPKERWRISIKQIEYYFALQRRPIMIKLNRILWPTDFSRCAKQALGHAVHWAKEYGAELHALHAAVLLQNDSNDFPNEEAVNKQLKDLAAHQLSSTIQALQGDDLNIKQSQVRGISTAPAILGYARENNIDLIVMGTHGRRGLGHLFLGSVAEEVVRLASCPVLTIREQKTPAPVKAMKHILVPVDFSEPGQRALVYAKEIAAFYGARLQLLHVIEEAIHPAFYMANGASVFAFQPELKSRAEAEMKKLLKATKGPEVAAALHVVEGRAAIDIVNFAEKNQTDLVVIATHGRTGIEHMLLGSVTEKVVRRAPCPVFTVRAFGKSLV
jgi:nucleotide-binding universal stress UspA family protein